MSARSRGVTRASGTEPTARQGPKSGQKRVKQHNNPPTVVGTAIVSSLIVPKLRSPIRTLSKTGGLACVCKRWGDRMTVAVHF